MEVNWSVSPQAFPSQRGVAPNGKPKYIRARKAKYVEGGSTCAVSSRASTDAMTSVGLLFDALSPGETDYSFNDIDEEKSRSSSLIIYQRVRDVT